MPRSKDMAHAINVMQQKSLTQVMKELGLALHDDDEEGIKLLLDDLEEAIHRYRRSKQWQ